MKLYSYFRSSAAYRVRIALNLKGIAYDTIPIHLIKDGGRHRQAEYRAVNPQMRVPTLIAPNGDVLVQSLAIIEYLEEIKPDPPLLPKDPIARAHVRALADIVACDIHPMNNLGPLRYLKHQMHQEQPAIDAWYHHWVIDGFTALEALVRPGPYSFGADVTLADVFLIPQVANARRLKVPLEAFPNIVGIEAACLKLSAVRSRPAGKPAGRRVNCGFFTLWSPLRRLIGLARGAEFGMIKLLQWVGVVSFSCVAMSVAVAQSPAPNTDQPPAGSPICVRLESQLAALRSGGGDPRGDQLKRYEDAVAKQQADLDRTVTQSKRAGCETGFFALFTGGGPQCQPINAQIQQMRDNLDRAMSELERLKSGSNDREGPRRALIGQLAQNNCGQQYQAAAAAAGPGRISRLIIRRHDHQSGRRRHAVRHLSHRLRAHVRRILFPDLVLDGPEPLS